MKFLLLLAAVFTLQFSPLHAVGVFDIPVTDIEGKKVALDTYRGKVLLIVNVASKCGFTKQYAGLETLYSTYKDKGLVILGFPCNQFGGQEPGTSEEIASFCSLNYNVTFPLFEKIEVNGPGRHPLYSFLSGEDAKFPGPIGWNFAKFLVGREGQVIARYDSKVTPQAPELVAAVEAALAAK
jgi:glutathione peroxidase